MSSSSPFQNLKIEKNQQIIVEIDDGRTILGEFYAFNKDRGRLELRNVKDFSDNEPLGRVKYFYKSNVNSIKLLSGQKSTEEFTTIKINQQQRISIETLANNVKVINQIDSNFHSAVEDLQSQTVVGVFQDGPCDGQVGRFRELSILAICTDKIVYLFDLVCLQNIKSLKKILTEFGIVKVIYDSKSICDNLYHCFGIELRSVFDVMLADRMLYGEEFPKGLDESIQRNLNLKVNFKKPPVGHHGIDWSSRPLTNTHKFYAGQKVGYLIFLYNHLVSKSFMSRYRDILEDNFEGDEILL